jgi:glycosyltransferase involved in cell wall biosynthesis
MKIAIILWDLNITGGTQRQALSLADELQNMGHSVDVFSYIYAKEKCYTELCDKLRIFSVINKFPPETKSVSVPHSRFLKKISYLIGVYKKHVREAFFADKRACELAKLIQKECLTSRYDVINLHDYQVYRVARVLKHSNIVWTLNDIQKPKNTGGYFLHRHLFNFLREIDMAQTIPNIKKIFVLDSRNRDLVRQHYERGAVIIRSGIDLNMFEGISTKRTYPKDKYQIFASSIFFPHRRYEDLVDAVEILVRRGIRNIVITINGINNRSYDYYLSIKNRIANKKLESYFTIINGMSEKELKNAYASADMFIFPNHNQTWGLAVFEAMLGGCNVIVSKTSGAHEVLTDKKNALLVNQKSPNEIADSIVWLIQNPKEMQNISEEAQKFVRENMSWKHYAENMLKEF